MYEAVALFIGVNDNSVPGFVLPSERMVLRGVIVRTMIVCGATLFSSRLLRRCCKILGKGLVVFEQVDERKNNPDPPGYGGGGGGKEGS